MAKKDPGKIIGKVPFERNPKRVYYIMGTGEIQSSPRKGYDGERHRSEGWLTKDMLNELGVKVKKGETIEDAVKRNGGLGRTFRYIDKDNNIRAKPLAKPGANKIEAVNWKGKQVKPTQQIPRSEAIRLSLERSKKSIEMDGAKKSKTTLKKPNVRWAKNMGSMDVKGIDTPTKYPDTAVAMAKRGIASGKTKSRKKGKGKKK